CPAAVLAGAGGGSGRGERLVGTRPALPLARLRSAGRARGAPRPGHSDRRVILPAVKVAADLADNVLAGEGAGEPHRHQRRLGARREELDQPAARGRDDLLDELAPADLELMAGAEVAALLDRAGHR